MKSDDKRDWLTEYEQFCAEEHKDSSVADAVLPDLRARLFPSPWLVFAKMSAIHAAVGFLSLGICNQFGLNPFGLRRSLNDVFMNLAGHHGCMFFCGLFFMMTTYLLANWFLTLEELETVRRHEWLQTGFIGFASLAIFQMFGADLAAVLAIVWMIGTLVGGWLTLEGSFRVRRTLAWASVE